MEKQYDSFSLNFSLQVLFTSNSQLVDTSHTLLGQLRALSNILKFHLISWCGNFVKRHSFRRVLGDSPEIMRKLCLSTKFPHQKIRWNYGILCSDLLCARGSNNLINSIPETALTIANNDQYRSFTRFVGTKDDSTSYQQNIQTLYLEIHKFINKLSPIITSNSSQVREKC